MREAESAAVNEYCAYYQGTVSPPPPRSGCLTAPAQFALRGGRLLAGHPRLNPPERAAKAGGMGLPVPHVRRRDQRERARNALVALPVTLRGP